MVNCVSTVSKMLLYKMNSYGLGGGLFAPCELIFICDKSFTANANGIFEGRVDI